MRLFTSDQHYGHANILHLAGRPHDSVDAMNQDMIDKHNAVVSDGDIVDVVGDVCMGKLAETLPLVGQLNGSLALWVGNHDRPFKSKGRANSEAKYLDAGFDTIHYGTQQIRLDDGTNVLIGHFPYDGDSQGVDRHADQRPDDRGMWLIHGHVHEKWRQNGRQINAGVDAWGGHPVTEEQIIQMIKDGPQWLDPIDWT